MAILSYDCSFYCYGINLSIKMIAATCYRLHFSHDVNTERLLEGSKEASVTKFFRLVERHHLDHNSLRS